MKDKLGLRIPQARVLKALMPSNLKAHSVEWPVLNRATLGIRAGYTAISGTITRALNGIKEGSSSGDAHPGLLIRKLIKEVAIDIDGLTEVNYQITETGISEYSAYIAKNGDNLPPNKDASLCVNERYQNYPVIKSESP